MKTSRKHEAVNSAGSARSRHAGRPALWLAVPLLTTLAVPAWAQTWKINLLNADINAFVSEVADITGKNFAVDPRVKGTVTVISNKALDKDQVYQLFEGVLNVNGVVAIPSGNTIKLVPDVNAKQSGVPFDLRAKVRGDNVVTRVIWLENTNPNDLVPALRPLLSQFAHLAAVPGTNALIVSDRAQSIDQLAEMVRSLDGTGQDQLDIIQLKETSVDDIVNQIESLIATSTNKEVRGSRLRIIADSRSNRLLIKGDDRARTRIKNLVAQLDVAPISTLNNMRVFHLKNASAKTMADMLQGLISGKAGSGSSRSSSSSSGLSNSNSSSSNSLSSSSNSSLGGSTTGTGNSSSFGSTTDSSSSVFSANGVSIIANEELNSIVVKADPSMMRDISSIIQQLDVRRAQVLIQAAIVEVSGSNVQQLGVQWALGNASSGVGVVNFTNGGASVANIAAAVASKSYSSLALPAGALVGLGTSKTNSSGQTSFYGAVLNALSSTTGSNLISVPSVMALDNVKAEMVVGQNVPFITGSTTTTSAGTTTPFTTIERKDVGVTLKVVPHIGEGGTLRLEVEQEVSSIAPTNTIGATTADLVTNKRSVKTTVLADDQQTIVLGGMMQDDNNQELDQVPGLGRIPLIGGLFRSRSSSFTKNNLLIFLQPTILRDGQNIDAISQERYEDIRSLQLQLDAKGQLTRLPPSANQMFSKPSMVINPALSRAMSADLGRGDRTPEQPFAPSPATTDPTPPAQPAVTPRKP